MRQIDRQYFRVKEIIALMRTGEPFDMTFFTHDKNRPEKCGRKVERKKVILSAHTGYGIATARGADNEPFSFHPVLVTKFNGTPVTP